MRSWRAYFAVLDLGKVVNAAKDYRYLLDRGYNSASALRVVEERYLLSRLERDLLFRGVHSRWHDELVRSNAEEGARRLKEEGARVVIDFFNALITISEAVEGGVLSVGSDGFLRDHAKVLGRSRKSIDSLLSSCHLLSVLPVHVGIHLVGDKNYPHSAIVLYRCTERLRERGFGDVEAVLTSTVDSTLLDMGKEKGYVVASSDAAVLERAKAVADIPMTVLKEAFGGAERTRALVIDLYRLLYAT